MSGHTKGDWRPSGSRGVVVYRGDRKMHVAGVNWVDSDYEIGPNQRLVCAAPKLLAALNGIEVVYTELLRLAGEKFAQSSGYDDVTDAMRKAREAIAAVEGT